MEQKSPPSLPACLLPATTGWHLDGAFISQPSRIQAVCSGGRLRKLTLPSSASISPHYSPQILSRVLKTSYRPSNLWNLIPCVGNSGNVSFMSDAFHRHPTQLLLLREFGPKTLWPSSSRERDGHETRFWPEAVLAFVLARTHTHRHTHIHKWYPTQCCSNMVLHGVDSAA